MKTVPEKRYLRSAESTTVPRAAVFFSCRPSPVYNSHGEYTEMRLKVAAATYLRLIKGKWCCRDYQTFSEGFEFWEWILGKQSAKELLWIFGHNLTENATYIDLWERIDEGTFRLNIPCLQCGQFEADGCKPHTPFRGVCVISNPPIIVKARSKQGTISFVAVENYFRSDLYKLGHSMNYPRICVLGESPETLELTQSCLVDTEIIEKAMTGLFVEWERDQCGVWKETAAGLSWSAFRQTVDHKQILIDHSERKISCERSAYYGGQAEVYYLGRVSEPIYLLDVRSLYPSLMIDHYFPVQYIGEGHDYNANNVRQRLQLESAVCRCVVRTEREGYPKRIAADNTAAVERAAQGQTHAVKWGEDRLGYPIGEYATALAGPELQRAIDRDELIEIQEIHWFRRAKIFGPFVEKWFAKRPKESRPETFAADLLCKTVLNSLSGKFGQHKIRWKDRPGIRAVEPWGEWPAVNAQTGKPSRMRAIGGHVQELEEGGEAKDSFPAISAYITAYGREQMVWLRGHCPANSVFYQNTDSLLVNIAGYFALEQAGLIGSGELGRLRHIDTLYDLVIYSLNDFVHDTGHKLSGVRLDAERVEPGVYRQLSVEPISMQWSRTPDGSVRVKPILVSLTRDTISRLPTKSGWTLPPRMKPGSEIPF